MFKERNLWGGHEVVRLFHRDLIETSSRLHRDLIINTIEQLNGNHSTNSKAEQTLKRLSSTQELLLSDTSMYDCHTSAEALNRALQGYKPKRKR